MNAGKALLQTLDGYGVTDVFGLPGETTLDLYRAWEDFPQISYHMVRDERSAVFMADAYAKATGRVGVCEGPSVGSTHMVPGVTEAYAAGLPIIVITSDVVLSTTKKNMLTGYDQNSVFQGITKETFTITSGGEIPFVLRRAFRCASSGRPGPVHIRIPMDIFKQEVSDESVFAQPRFARFPGIRSSAADEDVDIAAALIAASKRPVMVCGQGCVHSGAWKEILALSEKAGILVGSSINAKGIFPERHPFALGVTGARGGREWANSFILEADLIIFAGASTDSAETDGWKIPPANSPAKIIQIDISEFELGNNYKAIPLLGDAAETIAHITAKLPEGGAKNRAEWTGKAQKAREAFEEKLDAFAKSLGDTVHPFSVARSLERLAPEDAFFAVDPGIPAVYSAAFTRLAREGRRTAYNFAMGALGYAIPAGIGAKIGLPSKTVIALVGDGSFGFAAGELETAARLNLDITFVLFDNRTFGWIRGTEFVARKSALPKSFDAFTNFAPTDYVKIAEGFGLKGYAIASMKEFDEVFKKCLVEKGPKLIVLRIKPEDEQLAPVPGWYKYAKTVNAENLYGDEGIR